MCSLHSYDSWQLLPSNNVQNSDSQKRPEVFSVQKFSTRTERTKEMYRRAHHVVQIIIVVGLHELQLALFTFKLLAVKESVQKE